jgi:hypothetical protein
VAKPRGLVAQTFVALMFVSTDAGSPTLVALMLVALTLVALTEERIA